MNDQTPDPPEDDKTKSSIKGAFKPGSAESKPALFTADEMDIYCNKITLETFIFHGKDVDYDPIAYLEYDPQEKTVDIVMKDNTRMDLGVKIQWLVRPYFSKTKEVSIVQTKNREPIDGTVVPIIHKGQEPPKTL